jgi:hypothetical protein
MNELAFSPHPNISDHFTLSTSLLSPAALGMYIYLPLPAVNRYPVSIGVTLPVSLDRSQMGGFAFLYMRSFRPFRLIGESFRA